MHSLKMIVVFDTNVWLSQLGLRTAAAAGVRFFLKHNNYRVALPDVVRMEVIVNLQADLMKYIDELKNSHQHLQTVFPHLKPVVLPTRAQVEDVIPELFASIGVELINVAFTLESATSSFLKTIHKAAPSNNNQQFKDGVLWADCLSLLDTDDVILVTADKAFYSGHKYENGLANNLLREAAQGRHKLTIMDSLPQLLEALPKTIPFNEEKLYEIILKAAEPNVIYYLADEFELSTPSRIIRSLFATEDTAKLFFKCSVEIPCRDVSGLNREDALMKIEAEGIYLWESQDFDQVLLDNTTFEFRNEKDEEVKRNGVWLRTKQPTSAIRQRLNET